MLVAPINPKSLGQSGTAFDVPLVDDALLQWRHVREGFLQEIGIWRQHAMNTLLVMPVFVGLFWERWSQRVTRLVRVGAQVHG